MLLDSTAFLEVAKLPAMPAKLPARELQKLVFAYPTSASDIIYML